MGASLNESILELKTGVLRPEFDSLDSSCYPLPPLVATGETRTMALRVFELENEFATATIAPSLGGRLLRFVDKRSGEDVLPWRGELALAKGGPRGLHLPDGLNLRLTSERMGADMGETDAAPAASEDGAAALWIGGQDIRSGLGYHLRYRLAPASPNLEVEVRTLNRRLAPSPEPYALSFSVGWANEMVAAEKVGAVYDSTRRAGFAIVCEFRTCGVRRIGAEWLFSCFDPGEAHRLAPRATHVWSGAIVPIVGLERVDAVSLVGALEVGDNLRFVACRGFEEGRALLATEDGGTFTAPVSASLDAVVEVPLAGLGAPNAVEIQSSIGNLSWRKSESQARHVSWPEPEYPDLESSDFSESDLRNLERIGPWRGLALTAQGERAMRAERFGEANECFEAALMYHGDDPLLWWSKALALLAGAEGPDDPRLEGPEIENALYLAPLEPTLKVFSFLLQHGSMGAEPNPLLASLSRNPDQSAEVACHLLRMGRVKWAVDFLDEARRHLDRPLFRILLAGAHLAQGFEAEAAEQVRRTESMPIEPPYPHRSQERDAIHRLVGRFPNSHILGRWNELAKLHNGVS